MLSVLDTFSGIGGFSYGLEMLCGGYKTVAFCEVDEYCRKVLAKHWPDVPCYGDIKEVTVERLREDGLMPIDLVCGGFPCQDISVAGKGAGIQGARSGLWAELCRLIGEIRPRWAVMENVSALLGRGLGTVLGDLAAIGYDTEWHCIPASCVGAPHHRDRIWIVADSQSCDAGQSQVGNTKRAGAICAGNGVGLRAESGRLSSDFPDAGGLRCDAESVGVEGNWADRQQEPSTPPCSEILRRHCAGSGTGQWKTEPDVGRVADGIPARIHRLKCLGNGIVPQVVAVIGKAILENEVSS